MEDYRAKQRIRKKIYSPLVFCALVIVTLLLLKGVWGVYFKQNSSQDNLEKVRSELEQAKNREVELETSVNYIKTEEGKEEEIRDKYSVTKPGEELVLIVEPSDADNKDKNIDESWWGRVKSWFNGIFN